MKIKWLVIESISFFVLRVLPNPLQGKIIKSLLLQTIKFFPKTTIQNHKITSTFLTKNIMTSRLLTDGGHYTGRFVMISQPSDKEELESMIGEKVDEHTCESKFRKWLDTEGFKKLENLIDEGIETEK